MEVHRRGGGPVSWAKTKVNRTRSKGLYSPTRNIYVGTGVYPTPDPVTLLWWIGWRLARMFDWNSAKLSCQALVSISCYVLFGKLLPRKLLFSESSNNSLYFVLDADDLPPDPPSPLLKLTMYSDELFESTMKMFILFINLLWFTVSQ